MSYKIDKKNDVYLYDIYCKWPADPVYQLANGTSPSKVETCDCRMDALGPHLDIHGDWEHKKTCSIRHTLASVGVPFKGVTAIYVGDSETGEYKGLYVYYGSNPYSEHSRYFEVIEVKRLKKRLGPLQKIDPAYLRTADLVQADQYEKLMKGITLTMCLGRWGSQRIPNRMIYINGHLYASCAVTGVSDRDAYWCKLETYEY